MILALRPILYSAILALPAWAQVPVEAPISSALEAAGQDVWEYNDHVVFLASPFLEGRLPGTRGMEIAKEYVEHWFHKAGLVPAFPGLDGERTSFRQPFALGTRRSLERESLEVEGLALTVRQDYSSTGHGASGQVEGELCFVGYGVEHGPDDYAGFSADCDLSGKVCLLLRFEPLNPEGHSRWVRRGWSPRAGFQPKFRALVDRGAAAILLINTPGAADPRVNSLLKVEPGVQQMASVPVLHVSTAAASRLLSHCGEDLLALRKLADQAGCVRSLGQSVQLESTLSETTLVAENVGAILPGRGSLANQIVVVGAHLDHLGMGAFGSRDSASAGRVLHPGADDNASGVAGVIMIAERMARQWKEMPQEQEARTVLFMAFSAEESGLNGARHYTNSPIAPIGDHALMMNFDMVGRIENKRLSVSGAGTAEGMQEWVQPFFDRSELTIVSQAGIPPASDHYTFFQKRVPVLFAIIATLHNDYHTPRDVSGKINRVDAVRAMYLFDEIAQAAALRAEPFHFKRAPRGRRPPQRGSSKQGQRGEQGSKPEEGVAPPAVPPPQAKPATQSPAGQRGAIKVSFGIQPGSYEEGIGGIPVKTLTEGRPAEIAGVLVGDVLVSWDGQEVSDVAGWMCLLAKQKAGDQLKIVVLRGEQRVTLDVTLVASDRR